MPSKPWRLASGLLCASLLNVGRLSAAPLPPAQAGAVLIENSGSTNMAGCSVYISPSGHVRYAISRGRMPADGRVVTAELVKAQVVPLFRDLHAAMPLGTLPAGHGMRSASFGTRTYVTYGGQRSPDLSVPGDARGMALKTDVTAIMQTLHLMAIPRRPVPNTTVPSTLH